MPSDLPVPPVTITLPSGRAVSVSYERGWAIAAVSRQDGEPAFMSTTAVRPVTVRFANDGSDQVPDFITLPGEYITELEPSNGLVGPAVIDPDPCGLRMLVAGLGPALKTRPSGRTNWKG